MSSADKVVRDGTRSAFAGGATPTRVALTDAVVARPMPWTRAWQGRLEHTIPSWRALSAVALARFTVRALPTSAAGAEEGRWRPVCDLTRAVPAAGLRNTLVRHSSGAVARHKLTEERLVQQDLVARDWIRRVPVDGHNRSSTWARSERERGAASCFSRCSAAARTTASLQGYRSKDPFHHPDAEIETGRVRGRGCEVHRALLDRHVRGARRGAVRSALGRRARLRRTRPIRLEDQAAEPLVQLRHARRPSTLRIGVDTGARAEAEHAVCERNSRKRWSPQRRL
jgi:hypothetical protein